MEMGKKFVETIALEIEDRRNIWKVLAPIKRSR